MLHCSLKLVGFVSALLLASLASSPFATAASDNIDNGGHNFNGKHAVC
jgi:hypothetical protein